MASSRLKKLSEDVNACRRCPLWRNATQGVAGEGHLSSILMFVGEQPGDKEDLAGHPFVGPAGQMLDKAIVEAGITRADVFVTNAVKHFKNEPRGKRRLHKRPNKSEIETCRWWLQKELDLVKPAVVIALGATAAEALLQRSVKIGEERGKPMTFEDGLVVVTMHPSALLRMPDKKARAVAYQRLVHDLKTASLAASA